MFDNLMTDKVDLVKATGEKILNISANVQENQIFIQRSDLLIESGDLLIRNMSNGGKEKYEVVNPGYHESVLDFPAHYQAKCKNLSSPIHDKVTQHTTNNYNLSGSNARVNNHSTDNSTIIYNENNDLSEHISLLKNEINKLTIDLQDKETALASIQTLEHICQQPKPNKGLVNNLLSMLPPGGNIASICALILDCIPK